MPEVELLQLHRMNIDGKVYERGVRYPVDVPSAVGFASNARFRVHGLDMDAVALARAKAAQSDRKPAGEPAAAPSRRPPIFSTSTTTRTSIGSASRALPR